MSVISEDDTVSRVLSCWCIVPTVRSMNRCHIGMCRFPLKTWYDGFLFLKISFLHLSSLKCLQPFLIVALHSGLSLATSSKFLLFMLHMVRFCLKMSLKCFCWPPFLHFPSVSSPQRTFFWETVIACSDSMSCPSKLSSEDHCLNVVWFCFFKEVKDWHFVLPLDHQNRAEIMHMTFFKLLNVFEVHCPCFTPI